MTTAIALAAYAALLAVAAIAVWRRPIVALSLWIVGVAVHNTVGAALYGAGVRGDALTSIQAWKEILLAVALARVAADAVRSRTLPFRPRLVVALALKHDLIPVAAFFLGRAVVVRRDELVRVGWTLIGAAAVVAAWGLIDD